MKAIQGGVVGKGRMRFWSCGLNRQIAGCLVMSLALPFAAASALAQQSAPTPPAAQSPTPPAAQSQGSEADSDPSQSGASPATPAPAAAPATAPNQQSPSAGAGQQPPNANNGQPLGTAAAPYEKALGVPASRPAGAAIAPAKQRRTRSLLIKVGVLVGAGVAIGTIVALSKASPSRAQ